MRRQLVLVLMACCGMAGCGDEGPTTIESDVPRITEDVALMATVPSAPAEDPIDVASAAVINCLNRARPPVAEPVFDTKSLTDANVKRCSGTVEVDGADISWGAEAVFITASSDDTAMIVLDRSGWKRCERDQQSGDCG